MLKNFNYREILRYIIMICGFFFMAAGVVSVLNVRFGMPPWDVFHLGLHPFLGISYGQTIQGVGIAAIIISYLLGVKPKAGTFLNMFFIGLFVDLTIAGGFIPRPENIIFRLVQFFAGIILFSYGTMTYILADRGTGPRDSMMLALSRLSGLSMGVIRTFMEVTVTAVGFVLGGPLGVGTVIFALSVGPCMEVCARLIKWHNLKLKKIILKHPAAGETEHLPGRLSAAPDRKLYPDRE